MEKDNEKDLEKKVLEQECQDKEEEKKENEAKNAKASKMNKHILIGVAVLAVVGLMLFFDNEPKADVQAAVANSPVSQKKKTKSAREFEVKFLDSLDISKHVKKPRRHMAGMGAPQNTAPQVSNRLGAAYRLGMAFASLDSENETQRERLIDMVVPTVERRQGSDSLEQYFYDCVGGVENGGERGIAAIMMSGYYFGSLCTVLEYVNEESNLPDERTLAKGIKKMENLKEYLNESLKAEKEVKTTMAIQRLEAAADSVISSYYNCQSDYGEAGGKYDPLLATIKGIDDILK